MKKVLIISYHYPPVNNIAARRFSEMIPYMTELGWQPYVLTTNSKGDLNTNLSEKYIFRVSEHPQSKNTQNPILVKSKKNYRHKLGLSSRIFDRSFSWYKSVISNENLLDKLKSINFDLILASFGPGGCLFVGNQLSKELQVPWIVDFRDLGSLYQDRFDPRNKILKFIDRFLEKKLIKTASHITTVSDGLAQELKKHYSQKISVIYNGWDKELKKEYLENSFRNFKKPYIYYAGSFYEHQLASFRLLIKAIKHFKLMFIIRSLGPERLNQKLKEIIESESCQKYVTVLPPATANVVHSEQDHALINVVFEDLSKKYPSRKGVLTGKLIQLLILPTPVLAIARDDSEIGTVLHQTQKGALKSNEKNIVAFISDVLKNSKNYTGLTKAVNKFSKRSQSETLVDIFNNTL